MSHPSFFALDAYGVDPRPGDVEAHLRSCPRCQAHVAAVRVPAPFPAALEHLRSAPPSRPWWRFGLAFAAVSAALVVGVVARPEQPSVTTAKGSPGVALWLNRGGKVVAWSGQPVVAGDAVRIEVAPAGLTHVTIFDEHSHLVLYEADVPDGAPTLTPAWAFDGRSASESLRVVLSRGPVSSAALQATDCVATGDVHCTRFTLRLETP